MGLERVKLLVLDFDGVLTDNHVYVDQDGRESVRCYRGDGVGIERVKALGVEVIVISSEVNPVVQTRCKKLRVICWQGCGQPGVMTKLATLEAECRGRGITLGQVAYVGNDVNDLECLKAVGFPFVPWDCEHELRKLHNRMGIDQHGHELVMETVDLTGISNLRRLHRNGGDGCVREACDLIADAHKKPSIRVPISEPWRRTRPNFDLDYDLAPGNR